MYILVFLVSIGLIYFDYQRRKRIPKQIWESYLSSFIDKNKISFKWENRISKYYEKTI